jgi:NTP pyrophosphatase (non-canonical NTP hydrolase)
VTLPALSIGQPIWPGLAKLLEETGELQQVIGKLAAYPDGAHPDGTNLTERLHDELADVMAACDFVVMVNPLDRERIETRRARKRARFLGWHGQPTSACGRVLVGRGTDTYDPLCIRPAGHPGVCQP